MQAPSHVDEAFALALRLLLARTEGELGEGLALMAAELGADGCAIDLGATSISRTFSAAQQAPSPTTPGLRVPIRGRQEVLGALLLVGGANLAIEPDRLPALGHVAGLVLEHLRDAERAREAYRARTQTFDLVAHDLRSPLAGVLLLVDLLREELDQLGVPHLASKLLPSLHDSLLAMDRLTADLLTLLRFDGGRTATVRARYDPLEVADHAAASAMTRHAGLQVHSSAVGEVPTLLGDAAALELALGHLIADLVTHRAAVPTPIELRLEAHAEHVVLELVDRDAEDDRGELAQAFAATAPARTVARAAGLGLAIAKSCVTRQGGRLTGSYQPDRGSVITLALPRPPR